MKITSFSVLEGGRVVVLHARKILYPLPFWNKGFCERSFEKKQCPILVCSVGKWKILMN